MVRGVVPLPADLQARLERYEAELSAAGLDHRELEAPADPQVDMDPLTRRVNVRRAVPSRDLVRVGGVELRVDHRAIADEPAKAQIALEQWR